MDYQQLEDARLAYQNKKRKIRDVILTIYFGLIAIISISSIFSIAQDKTLTFHVAFTALCFPIFQFSFIALFAYIISTLVGTSKEASAYRNAYKSHFVTATFQKLFTDLSYSHDSKMPEELIEDTHVMNMGDIYSSNDYVVAKYKGLAFKQADVHIQEIHTDSDGDTTYETIFRGRWVIFDLKKRFEKRLIVEGKHFKGVRTRRGDKFKRIELESTDFNKNFRVFTQDGFEAYYLLDPAIMERIQKLSELHDGRVMVCFANNQMHIAINNNTDSFEPPKPNKPIDEQVEFDKVIKDTKVITNIVDELKLVK